MGQELSTTDRLTHTLAQWSSWKVCPARQPELLRKLGGKSNDAFLVSDGSSQFVVRINRPAGNLGVDRRRELQILEDIAAREYAPCVVYGNQEVLVTRYASGGHPDRDGYRSWLVEAGRLFRAIHETPTRVTSTLDPLNRAVRYFHAIDNPGRLVSECVEVLLQRPRVTPDKICLCHNDLLAENIIANQDGWIAIDWEYAAPGDPVFDLAVLVEILGADDEGVELLLAGYGAELSREQLDYYRDLYRLIDILWWRLKEPRRPVVPGLLQLAARLGIDKSDGE